MKEWSFIIAATLLVTWLVADTVREFFVNETIQYFSSEPHGLLCVAAIAIIGGFVGLGFYRLSPRTQRHIRVSVWGAAAGTLTAFVVYFAFRLASLSSLVVDSGSSAWGMLAFLFSSAIAVYLWFEFYRAWKTGASK